MVIIIIVHVLINVLMCEFLPLCFKWFQEAPVTGRKADVIKAAYLCAEAALRLVKPGNQVSASALQAS